ncbi:unnamed protein product, partial [Prorocentrum cordatum]
MAQCYQLQRWDQRVREGQAVAAGAVAAQRNVSGEVRAQRQSATTPGSARARRASSGSGHYRCSVICGGKSWSPTSSSLQFWDACVRKGSLGKLCVL